MKPLPLDIDELIEIKTPLVFNNTDTSGIKNLLLIDSLVSESKLFFDSANSDTFPIIYSYNSNRDDFIKLLNDKFKKGLDRISFVFHDNIQNGKVFLNQELMFLDSDILENVSTFSPNTQLLIDTIQKFNVKNIDFLTCNSLNYLNWKSFYSMLTKQTNVIVGASNDKTGNLNYGGDWVMENTNENVVNTYFNSNIQNYTSTLDSTLEYIGGTLYIQQSGSNIQYQYNSTSGTWTTITSWPVTIVNNTPASETVLTVQFTTNITISDTTVGTGTNGYFITGTSYITYDGTDSTVTIDGVTNYPGLIQNGMSSLNGFAYVIVSNIQSATLNSSTLINSGGWICQQYFGKGVNNVTISNCSNSGNITGSNSGGICGKEVGNDGGNITISNCYNTGNCSSTQGGGICSRNVGFNGGNVTILNCYNTGNISNYCSGICGTEVGSLNGTVTITNCYNTGNITSDYCGGFIGYYNTGGCGNITITNCYNTGNITGSYSGGFTGESFGYNTNNLCSITNCYNLGNIIGLYSGGICGSIVGYNDNALYTPQIVIQNCYSLGNIATTCGGICGGNDGVIYTNIPTVNIINCYTSYNSIVDSGSEYIALDLPIKNDITTTNVYTQFISSWSDASANSALTGTPTSIYIGNPGTVWTNVATNTPYILSAFNSEIYDPKIVTRSPYTIFTSGNGLFSPNYNYSLVSVNDGSPPVNININTNTGVITILNTNLNPLNIEKVFVSKGISPYYYGYNFNTFTSVFVYCFKEGSKILYLNSTTDKEEYISIQDLRKGDLVKTLLSGYKKVEHIGHSKMYNNVNEIRSKNKLYKCSQSKYPEIFEDLIITGCHSILIDNFKDDKQIEQTREVLGDIYITDKKYRLPACVDERAKMYEEEGVHTIWHFSLENSNYYMNYGVYANGLLVETTSNRMMKELAGLNLIK